MQLRAGDSLARESAHRRLAGVIDFCTARPYRATRRMPALPQAISPLRPQRQRPDSARLDQTDPFGRCQSIRLDSDGLCACGLLAAGAATVDTARPALVAHYCAPSGPLRRHFAHPRTFCRGSVCVRRPTGRSCSLLYVFEPARCAGASPLGQCSPARDNFGTADVLDRRVD